MGKRSNARLAAQTGRAIRHRGLTTSGGRPGQGLKGRDSIARGTAPGWLRHPHARISHS